jgi:hypothetical protein
VLPDVERRCLQAAEKHPAVQTYQVHQNTLSQMVFTRAVDTFILYFRDLLRLIFHAKPEVLRSAEHQETHEFILQHNSMDDLL